MKPDYAHISQVTAALAEGKCIEFKTTNGGDFATATPDDLVTISALYNALSGVGEVRVKPAPPKMVPLGPDDVPPGSFLRQPSNIGRAVWGAVLSVDKDGVVVPATQGETGVRHLDWKCLMDTTAEILISTTDWHPGSDWKRCEKEESK